MLNAPETCFVWAAVPLLTLISSVVSTPAVPDGDDTPSSSRPILRMFNHRNYNRDDFSATWEVRLDTSWRDLGRVRNTNGDWFDFNNYMTSYKVADGYTVIFYDDIDYGRELFRVPPKPREDPEIGTDGNPPRDRVESVRILDKNGREITDPRRELR